MPSFPSSSRDATSSGREAIVVPTTLEAIQARLSVAQDLTWADWRALASSPIWSNVAHAEIDEGNNVLDVTQTLRVLEEERQGGARDHLADDGAAVSAKPWQLAPGALAKVLAEPRPWSFWLRAAQEVSIGLLVSQGARLTSSHWEELQPFWEPQKVPYRYWNLARWLSVLGDRPPKVRQGISEKPWLLALARRPSASTWSALTWLLDHGEDPNQRGGDDEETALHVLSRHREQSQIGVDMARALLEAGARHDIGDLLGWLPHQEAVEQGHVAMLELLVQHGAPLTSMLEEKSASRHGPRNRWSLWMLACRGDRCSTDHRQMSTWLLAHGADPNEVDTKGNNALHQAIKIYIDQDGEGSLDVDHIAWLLDHGVDPSHRNDRRRNVMEALDDAVRGFPGDVALGTLLQDVREAKACLERHELKAYRDVTMKMEPPSQTESPKTRL